MRIVVALFCACISVPGEAATFYYVSGPYTVSNYDMNDVPLVTTGVLEIDESRLPSGQNLANFSFEYSPIPEYKPEFVTRLEFRNSAGRLSNETQFASFSFDSSGRMDAWDWEPYDDGFLARGAGGRGSDSDIRPLRIPGTSDTDNDQERGRAFLKQRGYREGTAKFDQLLAAHVWMDGYQSTPGSGAWFLDLLDAGSAIEAMTRAGVRNPPSNIYSIKPVGSCKVPRS